MQDVNSKGRELKYQLDFQVCQSRTIVVKIYQGDSADDIITNLRLNSVTDRIGNKDLEQIEKIIRQHT